MHLLFFKETATKNYIEKRATHWKLILMLTMLFKKLFGKENSKNRCNFLSIIMQNHFIASLVSFMCFLFYFFFVDIVVCLCGLIRRCFKSNSCLDKQSNWGLMSTNEIYQPIIISQILSILFVNLLAYFHLFLKS